MSDNLGHGATDTSDQRDYLYIAAKLAAPVFLILLVIGFAILEPKFLNPFNLFNVLRQVSIAGLIAIGMTFVILTAGIDLSVGSLLALAGMAGAFVAKGGLADRFAVGASVDAGNPAFLALLAALAVGMAGGALQGAAITRLRVPPFVVTLGGLTAFRGATLLLSGGGPISGFAPDYTWWGQGRIYQVPVPAVIFLVAAVIAHLVLRYTRFGLHVYATGGNPHAANLNGVPTARITLLVYMIVGFFCG
ncbi:MAG: ABC transporter permease, partial [Alphaproteobacteria bacterium]